MTNRTLAAWARAIEYLQAAALYGGARRFKMTFLEARGQNQNLVTVAPVPLRAAGALLLMALTGLAALRQRCGRPV